MSNSKSASSSAENPNTRWQFIDASNNTRSNLTQVKRHVMQEYMRQKKGGSRQCSESEEEPAHTSKRGRPKKVRAAKRRSARKAEKNSSVDHSEPNGLPPKHAQERIQHIYWHCEAPTPSNKLDVLALITTPLPHQTSPLLPQGFQFPVQEFLDFSPYNPNYTPDLNSLESCSSTSTTSFDIRSPRTLLSAARTDPFNSLPMELDLEGQRLFDFYVSDMPACSYGTHFRSKKAHNWYTAVFVPEAMKGAVAFQNTILVHAANTWAWVRNETENTSILQHRDRAVTMLREHLGNNPRDNSDVAIISCLSAAALEDFDPRPGHKEISWVHMRAAREDDKSECIPPKPLQSLYSIPSPPSSPSSILSDITTCAEPTPTLHEPSPIDELKLQCEEFLDFVRRCEQLSLYQKDNPDSCGLARHTAVQDTSLLSQILAAPPGARFTTSGDRKQMVARLTAMMMLNAALWDYRYALTHAATFLNTLEQAMVDSEVSMSGSVEAMLQILLACNDGCTNDWTNNFDNIIAPLAEEALISRSIRLLRHLHLHGLGL
ncbi:uncharacterized protein N7477_000490 [Penicillium maclennaniae]|uniref:uncharacterized protein n=1 Tax=Penicillium maclennaniae TaxID=1343394 RepID=UPI00253FE536|nr:uncharacterized protein N7477_000490 [Penicillium maclennaniae]KAJ5684145.1 hypothetical protein N7477_000490 [Penicillium maclennaniae]